MYMKLDEVYTDNQFDFILCSEVLEHIEDLCEENILTSLHKIVKNDGEILITYPHNAMNYQPYDLKRDPLGHRRQPDLETVKSRLINFEITKEELFFSGKQYQQMIYGKCVK